MKTLNKIAAVVIAATTIIAPVAFAIDGTTLLTAEACTESLGINSYDIDYGSFAASDVLTGSHLIDAYSGSDITGQVEVTNPCGDTWTATISVGAMSYDVSGPLTGVADIPATAHEFIDDTATGAEIVDIAGVPYTSAIVTNDSSDARTTFDTVQPLMGDATNNGSAGEYGIPLKHRITVPAQQPVGTYNGIVTFTVQ